MVFRYVSAPQGAEHRTFIAEAVPHKPVLILDGARQTGKTVLDRSAKDSMRIDLERDMLARSAIDCPKSPTDGRRVGNQDVILP